MTHDHQSLSFLLQRVSIALQHGNAALHSSASRCFMHSIITPRCQYTCMTETSHIAHLTYVSTRYGLGPSHVRTVAMSLDSLQRCFMHCTKTPRCGCVKGYLVTRCVYLMKRYVCVYLVRSVYVYLVKACVYLVKRCSMCKRSVLIEDMCTCIHPCALSHTHAVQLLHGYSGSLSLLSSAARHILDIY